MSEHKTAKDMGEINAAIALDVVKQTLKGVIWHDYLEWSGGVEPEDGSDPQIQVYIDTASSTQFDDKTIREILTTTRP